MASLSCLSYKHVQKNLRDKVKRLKLVGTPIVAQRLKRMPTINDKLKRFPTMNLSRMQDIGGIRAVVESYRDVLKLDDAYKNKSKYSQFEHCLLRGKNYIQVCAWGCADYYQGWRKGFLSPHNANHRGEESLGNSLCENKI